MDKVSNNRLSTDFNQKNSRNTLDIKPAKTARNFNENPINMDELGKGIQKSEYKSRRNRQRKSPDGTQ